MNTLYTEPLIPLGAPVTAECWFAIQTLPRHEKNVARALQEKGISTFLPLFSCRHAWSDRHQVVYSPLFPGYVFVKTAPVTDLRIGVLRTKGVVKFVGMRGSGSPIPDEEIDAIKMVLGQGVAFNSYPYLRIGQRVRIRGGALDGIEGILVSENGDQSLVISVVLLQRSIALRITGYHIETA
jgi:transcription antitermination factor NusG